MLKYCFEQISVNTDELDDAIAIIGEDLQEKQNEVIKVRRADFMNDMIKVFVDESVWKKMLEMI